jgi:hypothetical protein
VTTTHAEHWGALVAVAVLGADRHDVPEPPRGPLAALLADRPPRDAAESLLDQVAMATAVRRGGMRPAPARPLLVPCAPGVGRACPAGAVALLDVVLAVWPDLVDEWLARLAAGGWALPEEVAVALLVRFRADPRRRAAVAALAGELADWLAELFPGELAPRPAPQPRSSADAGTSADSGDSPPLPPEIAGLATLAPGDLASTMAAALAMGRLVNRHRNALVRLVAGLPEGHLAPLAEALRAAATHPESMGLALALADLAQTRLDIIRELAS